MADKPAQARKRQASASLRTLANELQIDARRRNYDMSRVEFSSLLENVVGLCNTPDQRRRAEEAKAEYFASTRLTLPPVPAFPAAVPGGSGASASAQPQVALAVEPSQNTTGQKEVPIKTGRSREALPTRYRPAPLKLGIRERRYRRVTVPPH